LKEEALRAIGWEPIGISQGIAGSRKSLNSCLVDRNVIGMAIATNGVKGQDNLGAKLANMLDHIASHLVHGLSDQGARMEIIGRAGHARVAIIQEKDSRQAKLVGGAAQLGLTELSHRGVAVQDFGGDIAHLTSSGTNEVDFDPLAGI
jgi:hypothetical protein